MRIRHQESIVRRTAGIVLYSTLLMFSTHARPQEVARVEVVAKRYEFVPSTISLKRGVPVVLEFRSEDVTHSIVVKELNVKAEIQKGRVTEIRLTPDKAGTFIGKCGHFCGMGHGRMRLTIEVKD